MHPKENGRMNWVSSASGVPAGSPFSVCHKWNRSALIVICTLVVAFALGSPSYAQLFGAARQLGTPLQRRQSARLTEQVTQDAGQVQGNERFLRGNRRAVDFVGSDRFERRTFVGAQQGTASGPVIQSSAGVRPETDRSSQINQPLSLPGRNEIYLPRLQVAFTAPLSTSRVADALKRQLANPGYFSNSNRFEVSVAGRTATLRGVVADARERDLAELLVSFEPGISEVRNELQIQVPERTGQQPRQQPAARESE